MGRARICGIAVGLLGAAGLVFAQERTPPKGEDVVVAGTVRDPEGRPVAGAIVGEHFAFDASAEPGRGRVETAPDGTYRYATRLFPKQPRVLVVWDRPGNRAAYRPYTLADVGSAVDVTVGALAEVRGVLGCREVGRTLADGYVNLFLAKPPSYVASTRSGAEGAFTLRLPPGTYTARCAAGTDFKGTEVPVIVPATGDVVELGAVDLLPTPFARHFGKAPPAWLCTDARNLPEALAAKGGAVQPGDFRGKWVLVEFWGWW